MTDRELLELAAKAAGLRYAVKPDDGDELGRTYVEGLGLWLLDFPAWWNPLTDDGDALRLAVKLCMLVECSLGYQHASVYGHDFTISILIEPESGVDAYAATRRAIVRAAAEIGMAMK